jgi:hypothetical protein
MTGQPGGWPSFGGRLGNTINNESLAIQALWNTLSGLQPGDTAGAQKAIQTFRSTIMGFLPSYQAPSDPWSLGQLPGATGTAHEGGISFNPKAYLDPIDALIAQIRSGQAPGGGGNTPPPGGTTPPPPPQTTTAQPVGVTNLGGGLSMPPAPSATPMDAMGGSGGADIGAMTKRRMMGV